MHDQNPERKTHIKPVELVQRAWQFTVAKYLSTGQQTPVFNPADDPVPGQGASQRGGDSGVESEKNKTCDQKYIECKEKSEAKLKKCIEDLIKSHAGEGCSCQDWNDIYKCLSRAASEEDQFNCLASNCDLYKCETNQLFWDLVDICLLEHAIDKKDCFREHVNCKD